MSVANGERVVKVGKKGHVLFEFGDEDKAVRLRIDVIAVYNEWAEMDRSHRDEQGKVASLSELNQATWEWVKSLIANSAVGESQDAQKALMVANDLSLANALEFVSLLVEEGNKLLPFIRPRSAEKPSSPESTELRFGT